MSMQNPPSQLIPTWPHAFVLMALLFSSVMVNVFQARKVMQLRNNLLTIKSEGQLAVGAPVPPIAVKDLAGNSVSLSYSRDEPPTVLYVFSPQCKWCEKNLQSILTLASAARSDYRFVALSISNEKLREYAAQNDLGMPIYTDVPLVATSAYKLGGTPQTIVVSNEVKVLKNWMGAYSGGNKREIEEFFNVSLPGIGETK